MNSPQDSGAVAMKDLARGVSEALGQEVQLTLLARIKPIADAIYKYLVVEPDGRRQRVVLCSSYGGPDLVSRAMANTAAVRQSAGESVGEFVLMPLAQGEVDGCSFAVVPYYSMLSEVKPLWWIQRAYYGPRVMAWLRDVAARTARPVPQEELQAKLLEPMEAMARRPGLRAEMVHDLGRAREAVQQGDWRPIHVMCHGDMWAGNVMIDQRTRGGEPFGRFVIIDWPGASMEGYPFYDFTRHVQSFQIRGAQLKRAYREYCSAIQCQPDQAMFHLLAALADLGTHLEHWPVESYVVTANQCYDVMRSAE